MGNATTRTGAASGSRSTVDIEQAEELGHVSSSAAHTVYAWVVTWCVADDGDGGIPVATLVHVECDRHDVVGAWVVGDELPEAADEAVRDAAVEAQRNADILARYSRAS